MKPRVTIRWRAVTSSPRRSVRGLAIVSAAALTLGGFGGPSATAATDVVVAMADDVILDPHRAGLPGSWVAARLVHRGLFAFPHDAHPDGAVPVPDLASGPIEVVNRTTYEIPVRAATFSNARVLSVADVVASLQRFRKIGTGAGAFAAQWKSIEAASTDPIVLRIRTTRPMPELAWLLAHPQAAILPAPTKSIVGQLGPAGLGPYRVATRTLERNVVLDRNPRWSQADDPIRHPSADRVILRIKQTGAAAFAAVAGDDADLIGDPGPPDVFDQSDAPVHSAGRCTRIVAVNHRASGLDRVGPRRAIRDALEGIDLPTSGTVPAASLLPPTVTGARERPRTQDGAPIRLSRTLRLAGSDTLRDRTELARIAKRLEAAGASVRVERREPALHLRLLDAPASARPDLLLFTWCAEWPGLAGRTFLEALTGGGRVAPRSSSLRDALSSALQAPVAEADVAWRRAERILRDAAVLVPVGWPAEPAAFSALAGTPMTSPMFPQGDPTNLDLAP